MSPYAIVQTGGKQYRVRPGDLIDVEKLPAEVGATVELDDVRLIAREEDVVVGNPQVPKALVVAEVQEQFRGKKLIIFKYKAKTRYRRKTGHRQSYTRLRIDRIMVDGEVQSAVQQPEAAPSPPSRAPGNRQKAATVESPEAQEPSAELQESAEVAAPVGEAESQEKEQHGT